MFLDKELEPFHVRSGQISILRFLEIKDGVNQESIRKYFHLDKGAIARNIRPPIKEGYINRKINPEDKRAYRIFLTNKGRKIMPDIKKAVKKWTDISTADFTAEEKETALSLLSRMSDNAYKYLENYKSEKVENG